jgi:hypothetical protein
VKRLKTAGFGVAALAMASLGGCSALDDSPNVGPCPVVGALYEAQRVVEVQGEERHENVGFTGAIESVRGFCRYVGRNPITMEVDITFAFGKGPKAVGDSKTYTYFTSVTRRDSSVLAKLNNNVRINFPKGVNEVRRRVTVNGIVIPRATPTISGTNFEVIVGFDLTPEQLEFNRSGKRFMMNVGEAARIQRETPRDSRPPKPPRAPF